MASSSELALSPAAAGAQQPTLERAVAALAEPAVFVCRASCLASRTTTTAPGTTTEGAPAARTGTGNVWTAANGDRLEVRDAPPCTGGGNCINYAVAPAFYAAGPPPGVTVFTDCDGAQLWVVPDGVDVPAAEPAAAAAEAAAAAAAAAEAEFAAAYEGCILVVGDVETNGPDVRAHSMFAFGVVAVDVATKRVVGDFKAHVKERDGATSAPATMDFWSQHPDVYAALHTDAVDARAAATALGDWLKRLSAAFPKARLTFASDCLPFDMRWLDAELTEHVAPHLLGHSGLDIYSYAAGVLGVPRHRAWHALEKLKAGGVVCNAADAVQHDHDPLNDALYEAVMAVDVIRHRHGVPWVPLQRLPDAGAGTGAGTGTGRTAAS